MTGLEVKAFFKKLWDAKFIVAGTMFVTFALDIIKLGLGFIVPFSFLFICGVVYMIKSRVKKV